MRRFLTLTSLAAVILASSCNKPSLLNDEKIKVDAEFQQAKDEMRTIDDKFDALQKSPSTDGMSLEQQHEKMVKTNTDLEAKLEHLSTKCEEAEAALSEFRPRLDTYKAKFVY